VPIDKVSFHLPEFAQRWKYIYHLRVAVERELSKETVGIKAVMELIKEAGVTPRFPKQRIIIYNQSSTIYGVLHLLFKIYLNRM